MIIFGVCWRYKKSVDRLRFKTVNISFDFCFSLKVTQLESQSISCFTVSLHLFMLDAVTVFYSVLLLLSLLLLT